MTCVNTNDNNEADDYPGLDLEEEESKHSVSLCAGRLCSWWMENNLCEHAWQRSWFVNEASTVRCKEKGICEASPTPYLQVGSYGKDWVVDVSMGRKRFVKNHPFFLLSGGWQHVFVPSYLLFLFLHLWILKTDEWIRARGPIPTWQGGWAMRSSGYLFLICFFFCFDWGCFTAGVCTILCILMLNVLRTLLMQVDHSMWEDQLERSVLMYRLSRTRECNDGYVTVKDEPLDVFLVRHE